MKISDEMLIEDGYHDRGDGWWEKPRGWSCSMATRYGTIGWVAYNPKRALMMEAYCYLLKEPAGERKLLFMEEAHNRLDYKIIKWRFYNPEGSSSGRTVA